MISLNTYLFHSILGMNIRNLETNANRLENEAARITREWFAAGNTFWANHVLNAIGLAIDARNLFNSESKEFARNNCYKV